jgi:hypothetical protein
MDKETKDKLIAAAKKKKRSLPIQIMESDWYDYNAGARLVLLIIALGQRSNPDARVPDDMPENMKADMLGWCDMTQARIALRAGKSESQVHKDIQMFRKDGVVQARGWEDENHIDHLMYRIVPEVIREHKRPSQTSDAGRPSRYKKKSSTRGRFTSTNQPKPKANAAVAGDENDA